MSSRFGMIAGLALMALAGVAGAREEEAEDTTYTLFEVSKVGKDKTHLRKIFRIIYPPKPLPKIEEAGWKPDRFPLATVHWVWRVRNKIAPKKYVVSSVVDRSAGERQVDAILHLRSEPEGGYAYREEIITPTVKTDETEEYLLTYRVYKEPEDNLAEVQKWEKRKEREDESRERRRIAEVKAEEQRKKDQAAFVKRLKAGEEFEVSLTDEEGKVTISYLVKW